jgi:hypothetical protein
MKLLISERQYKSLTSLLSKSLPYWQANKPTEYMRVFTFNDEYEEPNLPKIVFNCKNDFSELRLFVDTDQLLLTDLSESKKEELIAFLKNIDDIEARDMIIESNVIDLMEIFHGRAI